MPEGGYLVPDSRFRAGRRGRGGCARHAKTQIEQSVHDLFISSRMCSDDSLAPGEGPPMRLFVFTAVVATQLVAVGRLDAQTPSLGAPVVTSIPIGGITFRDTTTVRHFTYSVSKARPMALASDESGTSAVKRGAWIGAGVGVVAGGI